MLQYLGGYTAKNPKRVKSWQSAIENAKRRTLFSPDVVVQKVAQNAILEARIAAL